MCLLVVKIKNMVVNAPSSTTSEKKETKGLFHNISKSRDKFDAMLANNFVGEAVKKKTDWFIDTCAQAAISLKHKTANEITALAKKYTAVWMLTEKLFQNSYITRWTDKLITGLGNGGKAFKNFIWRHSTKTALMVLLAWGRYKPL